MTRVRSVTISAAFSAMITATLASAEPMYSNRQIDTVSSLQKSDSSNNRDHKSQETVLTVPRRPAPPIESYYEIVASPTYNSIPIDNSMVKVWRRAALKGDIEAAYNLGVAFALGQGVPQDFAQASDWYLTAAESGYVKAQFNIAYMYAQGKGVTKNNIEALKWYILCAASDDPAVIESSRNNRDMLTSLLGSEKVDRAQQMAQEWKSRFQRGTATDGSLSKMNGPNTDSKLQKDRPS